MNIRFASLAASLSALPLAAFAHEGHGAAEGTHWHATDAWGFAVAGAVLALVWFFRKK